MLYYNWALLIPRWIERSSKEANVLPDSNYLLKIIIKSSDKEFLEVECAFSNIGLPKQDHSWLCFRLAKNGWYDLIAYQDEAIAKCEVISFGGWATKLTNETCLYDWNNYSDFLFPDKIEFLEEQGSKTSCGVKWIHLYSLTGQNNRGLSLHIFKCLLPKDVWWVSLNLLGSVHMKFILVMGTEDASKTWHPMSTF